jgi:predicted TIM-barrel fold metal-dependent hydrolase
MDILDEQFERKGAQDLKKKPSDYLMSGNIFFSFEAEERLLPFFIQTFGSKKLIWASDYPHERDRSAFLEDLPKLFARKDISDDSRRMIFYENPKRLYRIEI